MRLKAFLFLVIVSIFFSACSSTGGTQNNILDIGSSSGGGTSVTKEDLSGNGLNVQLKFGKVITALGITRVEYDLIIENTGGEPIELDSSNFRFSTIQKGSNNEDIFTQGSLNKLYNKIFGGDESITLVQNSPLESTGFLELQEGYTDLKSSLNYALLVRYDYVTKFGNQVSIDYEKIELDVLDKISQAAPIQMRKLEMGPSLIDENDLAIFVHLEDRGDSSAKANYAEIGSFDLNFQGTGLGTCTPYSQTSGGKFKETPGEVIFDSKIDTIVYSCDLGVEIGEIEDDFGEFFETTIAAEFDYLYELTYSGDINLKPEDAPIELS